MPTEVGEQFISVETKDKCPRCGKINHICYEHNENYSFFICKECSTKYCQVKLPSSVREKRTKAGEQYPQGRRNCENCDE